MGPRPDRQLPMRWVLQGGYSEPRKATLDETEHVTLPAKLEVTLRQLEPVAQLRHGLEPGLRDLVGGVRDEDTE